ncbi:hypothetical protein EDB89DRAFT_2231544 [Lactarius sanguifluus]|nr:hypothetical protein EDB89DRAFT_2231544 [Lactarius sanguifluus]
MLPYRFLHLLGSHSVVCCPGHHSDSTFHTPTTTLPPRPLLALTCMMTAALAPASLSSPDAPSSSVSASLHVLKHLTDVPPLDDFHPVHQTTTESFRTPNTRPHSRNFDIRPSFLYPPPTTVSLQHNADLLTPSDAPNLPTSASSNPIPDNILPTVTTAPNASPKQTSETELGAAGDNGHLKPGSRKEKDVLDPYLAICPFYASTTATLDLPPKSPSLRSVADTEDSEIVLRVLRMISSNASPINTSKSRRGSWSSSRSQGGALFVHLGAAGRAGCTPWAAIRAWAKVRHWDDSGTHAIHYVMLEKHVKTMARVYVLSLFACAQAALLGLPSSVGPAFFLPRELCWNQPDKQSLRAGLDRSR